MQKRILALLLAATLTCGGLTACNGSSSQGELSQVESVVHYTPMEAMSFAKGMVKVTTENFLTAPTELTLSAPEGARIYYTLDGSEPDESAVLYEAPIPMKGEISNFPTSLVLRAKAYFADGSVSDVGTRTFFCAMDVNTRYKHVIFSITGDPAELYEKPDGIMYGDNVELRGRESEREVYVEAINQDGSLVFEQGAGIRIYGAASRFSALKSFKLFARKEYDENHGQFDLDLFGTVGADGEVIPEYDKLVLRSYGNDFQFAFIRDELNQRLAAQAGYTDCEAVIPAVVYLNGAYYGLVYLHESYCDDLFKDKYGKGEGKFELLEGTDTEMKMEEDDPDEATIAWQYNDRYDYFAAADLTDETVYAELCAFMDVENYLQNFAFNICVNNRDWPQNNFKCYRYFAAEGEEYTPGTRLDGRWRYLLHDMDYSMGLYEQDETQAKYNNIKRILTPGDERYSPLFAHLLEREDCRSYFRSEMERLMNGVLSAENMLATLDEMTTERFFEMRYYYEHLENLKKTDDDIWTWYDNLNEQTNIIRRFIQRRNDFLKTYLEQALAAYETETPADTP
ncbi:MAG: CotH kinase family protein [Oscillospiraceae bacterium]|nr:CotH kinase family protein [Oscillospiraceae bacterium]